MADDATLQRLVRFANKTQMALNACVQPVECDHYLRRLAPDHHLPVDLFMQLEAAAQAAQPPPAATQAAGVGGVQGMAPQQGMCQALDPSTGQQCRQKPVPGALYCPRHK
jgi:hypothetical protein